MRTYAQTGHSMRVAQRCSRFADPSGWNSGDRNRSGALPFSSAQLSETAQFMMHPELLQPNNAYVRTCLQSICLHWIIIEQRLRVRSIAPALFQFSPRVRPQHSLRTELLRTYAKAYARGSVRAGQSEVPQSVTVARKLPRL